MKFISLLTFLISLFANPAYAKLNIVTTIPDLAVMAQEIGGKDVSAVAIAKGTQDPHFIEAKPSYMVRVSRADLVLSVGLQLEIGWLPPILAGARNPRVKPGRPGYLEAASFVEAIEKPSGPVTRAGGDVHPLGNPHLWLDPVRLGQVAVGVADRMAELDPPHAVGYRERAAAIQKRMQDKTKDWLARVEKSGVKEVVTFHPTLDYFLHRFGIKLAATLEPKPGIPPTTRHILEVIGIVKDRPVPLLLIENFFDATETRKIVQNAPGTRVSVVPVLVGGAPGVKSTDDLIETLVRAIEGK